MTGQVRARLHDITGQIPLTPRGRGQQRTRRAVDQQWQAAARAPRWNVPPGDTAPSEALPAAGYPGAGTGGPGKGGVHARPAGPKRPLPMTALVALTVLSLCVGFFGTQGMLRGLDMLAATLDVRAQVSAMQAIAKAGEYTQPAKLDEMQSRMQALDSDLIRLQSDLPIAQLEGNTTTGGLVHMLRMATLLVRAGEYGVDAGQVLIPAMKGMLTGLDTSGVAAPKAPTLTLTDLKRVTFDVDTAGVLVSQALRERALVSDSDLRSIGLGSAIRVLGKLDAIAPKLPTYLSYVHYAAGALPALLGLTNDARYLLFNQDSDELRPTGGFLGNYALLTFSKGRMLGGIRLKDIYTLDCPNGGYQDAGQGCYRNVIPSRFAWLSDDTSHFGVRDSNLDPDFATSSSYIEQNYQRETGQSVDGVIAFTPALIGKLLDIIGGISLPAYGTKITSANLQDTIHYYHILYAYCQNSNFANKPRCQETITGGTSQTSDKKTFDSLLGSTLMRTIATAGPKLQGQVLKAALDTIGTRDLQIFFNNPQVEGLLNLFRADNTIPAVKGDQLLVVDANTGATYANGDLVEQVQDTITLNADGSAFHNMTLTYTYPWRQHLYGSIYAPGTQINPWQYAGVLLVMVPPAAQLYGGSNCGWRYGHPAEEPGRSVWGCGPVYVNGNAWNLDGTNSGAQPQPTTIRLRWLVPSAMTEAKGTHTYNITVVHQAGSHPQVNLTILGPNGTKLASASPENPPLTSADGGLRYTTPLLNTDQNITVSYKG